MEFGSNSSLKETTAKLSIYEFEAKQLQGANSPFSQSCLYLQHLNHQTLDNLVDERWAQSFSVMNRLHYLRKAEEGEANKAHCCIQSNIVHHVGFEMTGC